MNSLIVFEAAARHLSFTQAANELNVSEATIDRLRQNGQLNSKKILGQVMFSLDEVARFLYEA